MPDVFADLTLVSASALAARVDMGTAIAAIAAVLRGGFDPEQDLPRMVLDVPNGQLLLMPAAADGAVGQKFASVAPGNPAHGLDRIQAVYVLLDGETLAPTAILDGTALTELRTPAVSAAGLDLLAEPEAGDLVVFGTGPQAVRHVEAIAAIRPLRTVRLIGRDEQRRAAAVAAAAAFAPHAEVSAGSVSDVAAADLLVCATSASEPLFASGLVRDDAAVAAIGSHEAGKSELDPALLGRGQVVVESRRVARSEAGDVMRAVAEGALRDEDVVTLHEVFTSVFPVDRTRPRILKTCGMGWQDLVIARRAL
ncbi:ornithine cyclodeaminase family protein [Microbacterium azadirachtae]|uniref:Alanine dehydrogenase n=1 Tax=Microbacterium azadirachtae TaxID=582680 RepID=A0A0F0LFM1_9MICO|nr:ornithine cyclodeaminase family protein [Microbacterium azadirachtae]KJL31928.1 Alanine dehydrogenase [Microbacterium azadirachtae]